ncbi:MAG: ATP-dependent DNA helicase RecG, partial [Candidatus Omnitrophica bacterium]|nr:ATP-dependent DNA helicase RecG [Candidatus Omnitrophota bacterium]
LTPGQKVTVRGRIGGSSIFRAKTGTVILQVVVKDATGTLTALWFNQPYMRRWFPAGQELILFGMVERIGRRLQMLVPEFELIPEQGPTPEGSAYRSLHMGRVVPIYPATSGLHQRELRSAVAQALKGLLPALSDPLPEQIRLRHGLLDFPTALKRIHFPPAPEAVAPAQDRLTFDELFCFQLALGLRRRTLQGRPGIAHAVTGDLAARFKSGLPFKLTPGQEKAIEEITGDMAAPRPMHRLLQGEVGSGKTVVAATAIVVAIQSGFQAAVLAPTEVLARQHALTLSQLLSPLDLQVALLTSSTDPAARRPILQDLAQGAIPVVVGTHALLEPEVNFARLGLVVIDEQQKFGVDQRDRVVAKGKNPDLLILTATPIPRTLALTLYGEMEISTITERPAGRQPVQTLWMDSTRRDQLYGFLKKELDDGRQAYVVCPRIGKEMRSELFGPQSQSATELFEEYQRVFAGYRVALLHGRIAPAQQKGVFAAFKRGEIQLLVATQIIEVGVDVANATVMVVEGAHRFGLSQLHQLRGRVGRGRHEATCILMADPQHPLGAERLRTVVEVGDAFQIAEQDLKLRGPGQLLGKRQAGLPDLICLQWATQGPWLEVTRQEAEDLLGRDRTLTSAEGIPLKREVAVRFPQLMAGCA